MSLPPHTENNAREYAHADVLNCMRWTVTANKRTAEDVNTKKMRKEIPQSKTF